MKNILLIIWISFSSVELLFAQANFIEVKQLPKPDCELQYWKEFDSQENKLLVFPDSSADSLFLTLKNQLTKGWNSDNIKLESELAEEDYKKPLSIFGIIGDFKKWEKFGTPIAQTDKGFSFEGEKYDGALDGVRFISPTRLIQTGSSSRILQILQSTLFYKYLILKDGAIYKNAYSDSVIVEVDSIRKNNYFQKDTRYFRIFASKQLEKPELSYDSIVGKICTGLNLTMPDEKIKCYFHQTGDEFLLFGNAYFMTQCKDWSMGNSFGMTENMAIHCVGNSNSFEHETFHKVWELCVGKSSNSFFTEGIQEYYSYLNNSSAFDKSVKIAKRYIDFDMKKLAIKGNGNDFWGGPSENDWPVAYSLSGCFVKYLVDSWGLSSFKCVYLTENKEEAFEKFYHKTADELLEGFHSWIMEI